MLRRLTIILKIIVYRNLEAYPTRVCRMFCLVVHVIAHGNVDHLTVLFK
jgi:hypothetical protein